MSKAYFSKALIMIVGLSDCSLLPLVFFSLNRAYFLNPYDFVENDFLDRLLIKEPIFEPIIAREFFLSEPVWGAESSFETLSSFFLSFEMVGRRGDLFSPNLILISCAV